MDTSIVTTTMMGWLKTWGFWFIIIVIGLGGTYLFLWWNKKAKLKYNALEIVPFGNGKIGVNFTKAGVFGRQGTLGNLYSNSKELRFKVKDGRIIQDASTEDLHDIFGKKGFIVMRKADDSKILVPLSKLEIKNMNLLGEIAPANFRDASVDIIRDAIKETEGFMEKYATVVAIGMLAVTVIIGFIVAGQIFENSIDKSMEIQKMSCSNLQNSAPSSAP